MSNSSTTTVSPTNGAGVSGAPRELPPPARLWVPCAGEPLPVGTRVRQGEPLALDPSRSPAPVDGRVVGISRQVLLGGPETQTVILETESAETSGTPTVANRDSVREMLGRVTPEAMAAGLDRLVRAGVSADRWTSPDLLAQLRQLRLPPRPARTVLCGALDLDPVLPLQQTLTLISAMELAAGAAVLGKLAGAERVFIAVPEDTPAPGVGVLRAAAEAASVRLFPLPNEYPLAHPSLLIRRTIGRRLPPGRLPTDVGVLLLDAPAAVAVGRCFLNDEPMLRVPMGIYDRQHARAHILSVPVGSKLIDVLRAAEVSPESSELRAGHVLRDVPIGCDTIVGPAELTLFADHPHPPTQSVACLRCGWCVEACPTRIHPAALLDAAQQHDPEMARRNGLNSCIECGICSYVCPSRLPLLIAIRAGRMTKFE